jgi:hypothetical protein
MSLLTALLVAGSLSAATADQTGLDWAWPATPAPGTIASLSPNGPDVSPDKTDWRDAADRSACLDHFCFGVKLGGRFMAFRSVNVFADTRIGLGVGGAMTFIIPLQTQRLELEPYGYYINGNYQLAGAWAAGLNVTGWQGRVPIFTARHPLYFAVKPVSFAFGHVHKIDTDEMAWEFNYRVPVVLEAVVGRNTMFTIEFIPHVGVTDAYDVLVDDGDGGLKRGGTFALNFHMELMFGVIAF